MRYALPALLLPLLAAATAAQTKTFVVPPAYATQEAAGTSDYHWMVGQYTRGRAQQIYAKAALPPTPVAIRSFKMRRDGLRTTAFVAHKSDMEVYMSNTKNDPPQGYGLHYASNHGSDLTLVMKKRTIDWPGTPMPTTPPAPFTVMFPLDNYFLYKGNALVIGWTYDVNPASPMTNYNWVTDAVYDSAWNGGYQAGTRVNVGVSCPSTFLNYGYYPYPGSPFWKYGYAQTGTQVLPGLCLVGNSLNRHGPLTLPFDLTPMGAKGCSLYTNIVLAAASVTDPNYPSTNTGRIDFQMGSVPADPTLSGQKYTVQLMVADPTQNALGLRASYGREYTVGTNGFTGQTLGFCFYGYFDSSNTTYTAKSKYALYYSARTNIIELTY